MPRFIEKSAWTAANELLAIHVQLTPHVDSETNEISLDLAIVDEAGARIASPTQTKYVLNTAQHLKDHLYTLRLGMALALNYRERA